MKPHVLIIEDEPTARLALAALLEDEGYRVSQADAGDTGLALALQLEPDLILLDIRLPGLDGLTVLERLRAGYSQAAVLVMTAETTSRNAIRATSLGAFDYIAKPIDEHHLLHLIQRALDYRRLEAEARQRPVATSAGIPGMVGHSLAMQEVYKLIGRVAPTDATVLVQGESGTGKELVANAIHEFSPRARGQLVKVNCAAIPADLLEAELFGHEKGAFTHALTRRTGRFEQAAGGTLFLDEIAELPLPLQAKLLRALQERVIERLGGGAPVPVDFRLITASAQDLRAAVQANRFREDLYYRLHVVQLNLPPLRERKEDIPLLIQRFLGRSERPVHLRDDALALLLAHDWPGNVRELENVITRALVLAPGGIISADAIELRSAASAGHNWLAAVPLEEGYWPLVRQLERHILTAALARAAGNKAEAARLLGIQRRLLYDKLREFGMGEPG